MVYIGGDWPPATHEDDLTPF